MVAWLGTPRKPGFGYRRGWDEEVPNTPEIGDVSNGGAVRVSTHIDPPMLETPNTQGQRLYEKGSTGYRHGHEKERAFSWHDLPLLSNNSITVYFPPERPIPIHTVVYLIAAAASGASGPFVTAGKLCPSAGLTGSVSDSHGAI